MPLPPIIGKSSIVCHLTPNTIRLNKSWLKASRWCAKTAENDVIPLEIESQGGVWKPVSCKKYWNATILNSNENTDEIDKEDLDVPTILRVSGTKSSFDETKGKEKDKNKEDEEKDEDIPESGFRFDNSRYNWAKDKAQKRNEEENNDDEDSSSFLRMIMD